MSFEAAMAVSGKGELQKIGFTLNRNEAMNRICV